MRFIHLVPDFVHKMTSCKMWMGLALLPAVPCPRSTKSLLRSILCVTLRKNLHILSGCGKMWQRQTLQAGLGKLCLNLPRFPSIAQPAAKLEHQIWSPGSMSGSRSFELVCFQNIISDRFSTTNWLRTSSPKPPRPADDVGDSCQKTCVVVRPLNILAQQNKNRTRRIFRASFMAV